MNRAAWVMALLVVVLALPAFGVTAYLEFEISDRIHGVENERAGLVQLEKLANFQDAAFQYSLERWCGEGAEAALRARADAARVAAWPDVRAAWQQVEAGSPSVTDAEPLFDSLGTAFMSVGDETGMTYDAEFAGVSLADADAYRLPEALAQLRSARGLLCKYGDTPSLAQRLALKQRQVLFDKLVADAAVDTRDAIRLLEPRIDVSAVKSTFPVAKRDASRASADLGAFMLRSGARARAATQRSLAAANASLKSLLQAQFPVFDEMFQQRLADFNRQRLIRFVPGIVGLLAAVLVATLGVRMLFQHAALELERRRSAEQEAMAMHDVLTGIMNRRAFFTVLERAVQGGANHGVICIFDIDHFKQINDTYGHLAGDELLVRLAQTIGKMIRPTDAVARVGGDEFALFLYPPIERPEVERTLDQITEAMRKPMVIEERTLQCSVSAGAAWIGGNTMREVRDALAKADAALYVAKKEARGRWRFSEEDALPEKRLWRT